MPEDPLAQSEIAALTRRYEASLQIVRGDIAQLDMRLMNVEAGLARVSEKIDRNHAQIVQLLSRLVGESPT